MRCECDANAVRCGAVRAGEQKIFDLLFSLGIPTEGEDAAVTLSQAMRSMFCISRCIGRWKKARLLQQQQQRAAAAEAADGAVT
jgi:hypothetical protein